MKTSISYTTGRSMSMVFSASGSRKKKKDGPSGFPSEPSSSIDSAHGGEARFTSYMLSDFLSSAASHRERP